MSALDTKTANNASYDDYLSTEFIHRIYAVADLADSYIETAVEAQETLRRMASYQEETVKALYRSNPHHYMSDRKFYEESEYSNSALKFEAFKEDVYTNLVKIVVDAINVEQVSTTFSVDVGAYVKSFLESNINLNPIFVEFAGYMNGRTKEEVANDEVVEDFNKLVTAYHYGDSDNKTLEKHSRITVAGNTATIASFVQLDFWGEGISHTSKDNLDTLVRYFKMALGDSIVFMNARMPIDLDSPYTPQTSLRSMVKNVRIFKNGKVKITFHDEDGINKFVAPLLKINKLDSIA